LEYVEAVCAEIQAWRSFPVQPLTSIFFGGGTPSLLPVPGMARLLSSLQQVFGWSPDIEISLEIDPGTFTLPQLRAYQDLGVNRFSLGVQAWQDPLLERIGRHHRRADIDQALTWIHQTGVKNWSLDLISGLPEQRIEDWQTSLHLTITAAPSHLSCYDLVIEPNTAFGKQLQPGTGPLPTDELTAQMYRLAQQTLTQAGYRHYEISNYARPGWECRHNQVYWQNQSYYGFGLGATSYIQGHRFQRPRTRSAYYAWLQQWQGQSCPIPGETVSATEQLLETLMLGLRLAKGVTLPALTTEQQQALFQTLGSHQQRGWISLQDAQGRPCSDPKALYHLQLQDPEGFLFSNTVLTDIFDCLTA
jgi:oxygen-independent coproporphyrinogen-3 oxidase